LSAEHERPSVLFGGSLKDVPAVKLGSLVIKEALKKAGLRPKSSEELLDFGPDALKGDGLTDWKNRLLTGTIPCGRSRWTR
jgi:acetyl-CoA acetyltransferase (EC 2.3.1.9)